MEKRIEKHFKNKEDAINSFDKKGFRCPMCSGISKSPYECTAGIMIQDLKGEVEKKPCDWKVGGLFRDLGKGAEIFIGDKHEIIFMPIAWEGCTDEI